MPKSRDRRKTYFYIAMLLFAVVVVSAVIVSQTQSRKPLAKDYFTIVHTRSIGTFYNQNRSVILTILGLNITAVGGDATAPQILCDAQASPVDDVYDGTLAKGKSWDMPVALTGGDYQSHGLPAEINAQGMFEVEVTIGSQEVQQGDITVLIDPADIVRLPSSVD
jgi:hypothetical protein